MHVPVFAPETMDCGAVCMHPSALYPLHVCAQSERMAGYWAIHGRDATIMVLLSSCLALGYSAAHSMLTKHAGAAATTVVGEAKVVGVLLLSYFILGARRRGPCSMQTSPAAGPMVVQHNHAAPACLYWIHWWSTEPLRA